GCDLVTCSDDSWGLDVTHNLERLTIKDENTVTAADIKKLLIRVGRQGQIAGERRAVSDELLYELAILVEHLDTPVFPVSHINGSVLRDSDCVHDAELIGPWIRETLRGNHLAVVIIHRLVT